MSSQVALVVKSLPANAGDIRDTGLIPVLGRSPGEVHGNPLQYSCLENPMDRGVWWATVHGIAKSWTRLMDIHIHRASRSVPVCEEGWHGPFHSDSALVHDRAP